MKTTANNNKAMCVTAFIAPKSQADANEPRTICVGVYRAGGCIERIFNFTNPHKALKYAFILKAEARCAISKPAFAILMAEVNAAKAAAAAELAEAEKAAEAQASTTEGKDPAPKLALAAYEEAKAAHEDAIAIFRAGDWYETYEEDATVMAEMFDLDVIVRRQGKASVNVASVHKDDLDKALHALVAKDGLRIQLLDLPQPKPRKRAKKTAAAA